MESLEDRPIKEMTKKDLVEEGTNAMVSVTRPVGQHSDEMLDCGKTQTKASAQVKIQGSPNVTSLFGIGFTVGTERQKGFMPSGMGPFVVLGNSQTYDENLIIQLSYG